jgi:hypothetical protein
MKKLIPLFLIITAFLTSSATGIEKPNSIKLMPTIENAPTGAFCPNAVVTLSTQEYDSYQWYIRTANSTSQPIEGANAREVTITVSTLYYVKVEVTLDGESAFSTEVTLDMFFFIPPVYGMGENVWQDTNTGVVYGCYGNFKLDLFGADSIYYFDYQWYRNNQLLQGQTANTLKILESGDYYYKASPYQCPDALGYSNVFKVRIIKNDPPTVTQSGDSLLASWNIGQWYYENVKIPGATSWILLPQQEGNYAFEYKRSGCAVRSDNFLYTHATTVPILHASAVNIYPQPAVNVLNFETDITVQEYEIFNSFGRLVDAGKLNSNQIDISSLPSGIYILQLNGSLIKKFVVTK